MLRPSYGELSPNSVELSLLRMLQVQEQRAWHDIVTLDESWFYCGTDHNSIWLGSNETVAEKARVSVQCKQLMIIIVWDPTVFQVIRVLPSECNFNRSYDIQQNEILGPLSEC
jgi:hypothetical protein